ncbi:MAG: hypothetical protein SGJ04_10160, partial [Bacteroidota bacterium]|nr:hypothetical protein [Bacteroidota bacterium]
MTLDFKSDLFSIRIISVTFCDYIKQIEIPAFRGAFAEKVGFENELFHNHKAEGGFHYSYPLI